ncbi:hypothetical protein PICSAR5_03083 [Mycobacterium avium subsp. paratuberculosis]|nr:hypothetical protein PICSAR118_03365 [Mycobacterium avium subsp. paratuberculosis]CAG7280792.1 hypothetical protein PICSAR5_03083 [Mycobacterium avium subsp. paratuberculosis]
MVPKATSAPISPGGVIRVKASKSAPSATSAPRSCACATRAAQSVIAPLAPGSWAMTPKKSPSGSPSRRSAVTISMPSGRARVATMAAVWANTSASTASRLDLPRDARRISVIASAAAVPSSSIEALAISRPVKSATMVWKFSSASSRPWLISG